MKKVEFLSTCFICIASCLKCGVLALFEIDTFQIPFSASEGALFFFSFGLFILFLFFVLFCFVLSFFVSVFRNAKFVKPS